MANHKALIVALPLDQETGDIILAATELARRLELPIVPVHALGRRGLESQSGEATRIDEAQKALAPHLAAFARAGLEVQEAIVAVHRPADLVIETAQQLGAELIVTGGGRPATVRRWLVGSVAEAIVRRASAPVWIARGSGPGQRPVLCPVDLSPQSKIALRGAIRMARAFGVPLEVITVLTDSYVSNTDSQGRYRRALAEDEDKAREQVKASLADLDTERLEVRVSVTSGPPAERIIEAADEAGLLVIASRGYDPFMTDLLGPVTSRALRYSHCSTLTIREVDEDLKQRELTITSLANLYQDAVRLMRADRAAEALPLIERAAERAPANAAIQDVLAKVLEQLERHVEARGRREIAAMIRERIAPT